MTYSNLPSFDLEWGVSENRISGNWISFPQFDSYWDGAITEGVINAYEQYYDDFQVEEILSGGAGNAELEERVAENGYIVEAVDKDQSVVDKASEKIVSENLTVTHGDIAEPERTSFYDLNMQASVLQELVGPELGDYSDNYIVKGFEGIRDSLRPGGLAFVVVPSLENMLEVVDYGDLEVDDSLDVGNLVYTSFEFENGEELYQYGFTHEDQEISLDMGAEEESDFDLGDMANIEEIARMEGLEVADTEPLKQWVQEEDCLEVDGEKHEFDFEVGDSFIELPAEPTVFTENPRNGKKIHEVVSTLDWSKSEKLRKMISQEYVEEYRKKQLRNPELGPRATQYIFRKPV